MVVGTSYDCSRFCLFSWYLGANLGGFFCCRPILKVDASEAVSKMAGLDGEGGRWDEFDIASEAFQEMVEEQKESLKGVLEEEVMELNQVRTSSRMERLPRWSRGHPSMLLELISCTRVLPWRGCEFYLRNIKRNQLLRARSVSSGVVPRESTREERAGILARQKMQGTSRSGEGGQQSLPCEPWLEFR